MRINFIYSCFRFDNLLNIAFEDFQYNSEYTTNIKDEHRFTNEAEYYILY